MCKCHEVWSIWSLQVHDAAFCCKVSWIFIHYKITRYIKRNFHSSKMLPSVWITNTAASRQSTILRTTSNFSAKVVSASDGWDTYQIHIDLCWPALIVIDFSWPRTGPAASGSIGRLVRESQIAACPGPLIAHDDSLSRFRPGEAVISYRTMVCRNCRSVPADLSNAADFHLATDISRWLRATLALGWFRVTLPGSRLVPSDIFWFPAGSEWRLLVLGWFRVTPSGSRLVPGDIFWFSAGSGWRLLVLGWFRVTSPGSRLVPSDVAWFPVTSAGYESRPPIAADIDSSYPPDNDQPTVYRLKFREVAPPWVTWRPRGSTWTSAPVGTGSRRGRRGATPPARLQAARRPPSGRWAISDVRRCRGDVT